MYVAIDIGGTNTRIATFESLDISTKRSHKKILTEQEYRRGLKNIEDIIEREVASGDDLEGIGIALASGINETGETILNPNINEWKAENISSDLEKRFNIPPKIINDASAGTLAEAVVGPGKKYKSLTFLTWGTGLGGATIKKEGGKCLIYEYEPGHIQMLGDGRKCLCGKKDCIESYVGGKAVEDNYQKSMAELAGEEWDEVLDYMRAGINQILLKHPVNNVVLSGKIIREKPEFVKSLESAVDGDYPTWVRFEKSELGEDAPLYGALLSLSKNLKINFYKEF